MTNTTKPSGENVYMEDTLPDRKISGLEKFLGPENYRIVTSLLKTPTSVAGFSFNCFIHIYRDICPGHCTTGG